MSIPKGDAGTGTMPGSERRGINLRLANIALFLSAAIERNFVDERPAFAKHDKSGGSSYHGRLEVDDGGRHSIESFGIHPIPEPNPVLGACGYESRINDCGGTIKDGGGAFKFEYRGSYTGCISRLDGVIRKGLLPDITRQGIKPGAKPLRPAHVSLEVIEVIPCRIVLIVTGRRTRRAIGYLGLRIRIRVVIHIHGLGHSPLPQIAKANRPLPFFLRRRQGGQQQRRQNADDGNHHQKLNERESAGTS